MLFTTLIWLLSALYMAVSIGSNDETLAPLAGSGAFTLESALLFGAVASFLGAVMLGEHVEGTIGRDLLTGVPSGGEIFLVLFCVALFLTLASYWGLPVSTTHSTVGAVIGLGVAKWGLSGVSGRVLLWVGAGWVVSPLVGLFGAYMLDRLFTAYRRRRASGLVDDLKLSRLSALLLFFWVMLTAFSRGGNDVANVTGLLVRLGFADPFLVRLLAGLGMALGLYVLGRRVVRTVGVSLVKIDPVSGLAAQVVVAVTLLVGTLLGLPLSGSHVLVGSIVGLGVSSGRYVDVGNLREITLAWVATFIGTFMMSYIGYIVLSGMRLL